MKALRPKVLITEQAIAERVDQLAAQISREYAGVEGLLLVGVLKGSFTFLAAR
jgi:hypoxanthine phosphoribosyltransferase